MSDYENNPLDWLEKCIAGGHIRYFEFSEFKDLQKIGNGSSGCVYRANWKNTDKIFALKMCNNNKTLEEVVNELTLQRSVDFHENIIRFYGVTKKETDVIRTYPLVLQYADSGTLTSYLNEHFNELEWNDKYQLALQLASAVACIHECGIIHCDLHAGNIFIHQKKIKVADFGLSRKTSSSSSKICGIIRYLDPRALDKSQNYELNKKSDVYSVGILMWQISSGYPPFFTKCTRDELILSIIKGERDEIIDGTPVEYSNLYTKCWKYEPNERPEMQVVVSKLKTIISSEQHDITTNTILNEIKNYSLETDRIISESNKRTTDLINELMASNDELNINNFKSDPHNNSSRISVALIESFDSTIYNSTIYKLIMVINKKHDRGSNQFQRLIDKKISQLNQLDQEIDKNFIIKKSISILIFLIILLLQYLINIDQHYNIFGFLDIIFQ
ncbi:hypothetical protein RclHR1_00890011 [Rhizophagus clarus]|uniref:Kinase-like domain-containing protein n=1 Tax=Rhizophagus clarus TaxID=94130 RepID=A0A2Z6SD82_9GLOM|nr:hypothetical protein RclHR1_00890011 [Rhizophagus clarus]GES84523.1 kinase-like domain-containing protein [Rhizophagus clarus]